MDDDNVMDVYFLHSVPAHGRFWEAGLFVCLRVWIRYTQRAKRFMWRDMVITLDVGRERYQFDAPLNTSLITDRFPWPLKTCQFSPVPQ